MKDKDLIDWLRYNVGVSDCAVTAAHLAADRIQELLNQQDLIREAALRDAYEVVYKWWFDDGNALPQELILALIGEKK